MQAWSADPSTPRGGRQGRRESGAGGGSRRWSRTGASALAHGRAEHAEEVLQSQHGKAARHVENGGGGAQSGLMHTAQAADALPGHLLPGAGAGDLGGVEGQAGQGEVAARGGAIAAPPLLLQPPALLEFAVRVILTVPARPIRLQGGEAVRPGAGADQAAEQRRAGRGVRLADQAGPQGRVGGAMAGGALPSRTCINSAPLSPNVCGSSRGLDSPYLVLYDLLQTTQARAARKPFLNVRAIAGRRRGDHSGQPLPAGTSRACTGGAFR